MKKNLFESSYGFFETFEKIITLIIAVVIALIVVVSLIRIGNDFVHLFIIDIFEPQEISFDDYKSLFAKILTLFISLEFMNSILRVIKSHDVSNLVLDVFLIAAMAIGRKLIILDYDKYSSDYLLSIAGLIISLGAFYFLVSRKMNKNGIVSKKDSNH